MTRRCVVDIFKRVKILILENKPPENFFHVKKKIIHKKNFWKNYLIVKFLETEKKTFFQEK